MFPITLPTHHQEFSSTSFGTYCAIPAVKSLCPAFVTRTTSNAVSRASSSHTIAHRISRTSSSLERLTRPMALPFRHMLTRMRRIEEGRAGTHFSNSVCSTTICALPQFQSRSPTLFMAPFLCLLDDFLLCYYMLTRVTLHYLFYFPSKSPLND
jgi:hypothetical protein